MYFPFVSTVTVNFIVDDLTNHYRDTTITMVTGAPTAQFFQVTWTTVNHVLYPAFRANAVTAPYSVGTLTASTTPTSINYTIGTTYSQLYTMTYS